MVFEKVREIICDQLDVAEDDVTMESNIADDLGADFSRRSRFGHEPGGGIRCRISG